MLAVWQRRRLTVALLLSAPLVAALLGISVVRGCQPRGAGARHVRELSKAGAREYATLGMTPLGSIGEIREVLRAAPITEGEGLVSSDKVSSLQALVAEFLYYAYCSDTSADYRTWRSSHGDRLLSTDAMKSEPRLKGMYEILVGEPMPDGVSPEDAFDTLWHVGRTYGDGACMAVSIANEPKGLLTEFKRLSEGDVKPPTLSGEMGPELWVGGISMMANNWWRGAVELAEAIERDGEVIGGYFAAILEFADGCRRPMVWAFFWDPHMDRWQFFGLFITNKLDNRVTPPAI
ncbi:MAG: hypothetical protein SYC29_08325 [Planctomycetota bacterium]|nr:hypothetical protein [Planctomycetota bacterium]